MKIFKSLSVYLSIIIILISTANSQEMPDSALYYDWEDTLYTWDEAYYEIYTYSDSVLARKITKNKIGFIYEITGRTTFTYDSNKQLREILKESLDGSVWENVEREVYNFDTHGMKTCDRLENWNGSVWNVINGDSSFYVYDTNGRVTQQWKYQYVTILWRGTEALIYSYDDSNIVTEAMLLELNLFWDTLGNYTNLKWQLGFDLRLGFKPTDYIFQDYQSEIYIDRQRFISNINDNKVQSDYTESWDDYGGVWKDSLRTFYTYTAEGEEQEEIKQFLDDFSGQWTNDTRESHIFDSKGNIILYKFEEDLGGLWVINDGIRHSYKYDMNDRIVGQMNELFYSGYWFRFDSIRYFHQPSSVKSPVSGASYITVYPNPATDFIIFKMSLPNYKKSIEVNILDMCGRRIRSIIIDTGNKLTKNIDIRDLQSGIYIVTIKVADTLNTFKLIKK